ncbi:DMP19 family protein [Flavobacterium suzhouense]|uniref:DNA mimic protein DMP19 C-terminal domain-containing protein n=1 Tax=Flavobacterium suzhouense TaxID=1529638 RepID=A0ABW5NVW4_9FLAO
MKLDKIIVSENSFKSTETQDIINSNIAVINLLREEGVKDENIHEDALTSYYLDYYTTHVNSDGFAKFVHASGWTDELNTLLEKAFEKVGSQEHLDYFLAQTEKIDALTRKEFDGFMEQEFGKSPVKERIDDDTYFEIPEALVKLNADFLRNHPDLKVLSIDDMYTELEKFTGKKLER